MFNVEPERNSLIAKTFHSILFIAKLFCQSSLIPLIICPVIPYPIKEVNGKHIYPILQLETLIAHNS